MIPVKNVYYMLSYAFYLLKEQGIKEEDVESFDNIQKLYAEILIKGVTHQIKRGLNREYIPVLETLSAVRGKIDISASLKSQTLMRRQLVCQYDEFLPNTELNRIIKTTLMILLRSEITGKQKKEIRKLLVFFEDVDETDVFHVKWNHHYNRNNASYQLLLSICYLVIKGLLQTRKDGYIKLLNVINERELSNIYEKFILEYYRTHYPQVSANAAHIPWQLDTDNSNMLPRMRSDIMLQKDDRVLIIDAKYYSHNTQIYFERNTIHSGNLYQIFTYVKNKEYELRNISHEVSGMLLYAKTDEEIQPEGEFIMSGNKISVRTIDLSSDFEQIKSTLDGIAESYYGLSRTVSKNGLTQ
ncbi:MAG: 5-methylcytosine-specific restriction endonuclease system specificity protein McrC [Clostridia bacterium]|nr:5-methylcytosine-specific restriction endonuclease system specificity protein McrC [Clostridia bacterium]